MKTSPAGIEFNEHFEGVVLNAYRDVVGVWTIGSGLTKASGVVVPKAGMKITALEAKRLMALALERNYEPRVAKAMPNAEQHEFDMGSSFVWNTGNISSASWLKFWRKGDWAQAQIWLLKWNKAGGKVFAGLTRRRQAEFDLLKYGRYVGDVSLNGSDHVAPFVVALSDNDITNIRKQFLSLGYDAGDDQSGVLTASVKAFQKDHALYVDGIIGKATISTLQRMVNSKAQAAKVAAGATGATGVAATGINDAINDLIMQLTNVPNADLMALAAVGLYAIKNAVDYRDAIAARIQNLSPQIANLLRSF